MASSAAIAIIPAHANPTSHIFMNLLQRKFPGSTRGAIYWKRGLGSKAFPNFQVNHFFAHAQDFLAWNSRRLVYSPNRLSLAHGGDFSSVMLSEDACAA
jgi:hypothetical protein